MAPAAWLYPMRIHDVVSWQWAAVHGRDRLGGRDNSLPSTRLCAALWSSLASLQCDFSERRCVDETMPRRGEKPAQGADSDTDTYT